MKYTLMIFLLMACSSALAGRKPGYESMKYDSVAVYRLGGNMTKSGAVDYFWKERDSVLHFIQSLPPEKMKGLFQAVNKRSLYMKEPEWTPGYNVSVVFFFKKEKVGYMSFNFRGRDGGSACYSHYVPAFEAGVLDMTKRGGGRYYPPFTEKGIEKVRQFFLAAGLDSQALVTLRGKPSHNTMIMKKK
jgi:hypothetical protein